MKESIPHRRLPESVLHSLSTEISRRQSLLAHQELDLPELLRLKSAPRLEPVAEREKVERRDRLEHIDLGNEGLEDGEDALQRGRCKWRVVRAQELLEIVELVQHLLEPQLVDLMDDDEERLVVLELAGVGDLQREQLVEPQVTRIRDGHSTAVASMATSALESTNDFTSTKAIAG